MPKTIETTVYEFKELSDKAKDRAREWFREGHLDYEWYEFVKTDFESFLESVGFKNVSSQFSGFWSQGDGASFDYKGVDFKKLFNPPPDIDRPEYLEVLTAWSVENRGLIASARRIAGSIHAESFKNGYGTHYCHSRTRGVSMELDCGSRDFKRLQNVVAQLEKSFDSLCEKLADKYYRALESEYDYLNDDKQVDESIESNEYTFNESGKRFG